MTATGVGDLQVMYVVEWGELNGNIGQNYLITAANIMAIGYDL